MDPERLLRTGTFNSQVFCVAAGFGAEGRVPGLDRAATGGSEKRTQVLVTTTSKVMIVEIFTQIGSVIVQR